MPGSADRFCTSLTSNVDDTPDTNGTWALLSPRERAPSTRPKKKKNKSTPNCHRQGMYKRLGKEDRDGDGLCKRQGRHSWDRVCQKTKHKLGSQ